MTLYRRWGGYPECHGQELCDFLTGFQITASRVDQSGKWANGAGCLAAQIVAHFKEGCGDFYLLPLTEFGEYEWAYHIEIPFTWSGPAGNLHLVATNYGEEKFSGTLAEFSEYLKEIQS
jgi:hypothetical protein